MFVGFAPSFAGGVETATLAEVQKRALDREAITFKKNDGWCWFQDERAWNADGKLLTGSVTSSLDRSDKGDIGF